MDHNLQSHPQREIMGEAETDETHMLEATDARRRNAVGGKCALKIHADILRGRLKKQEYQQRRAAVSSLKGLHGLSISESR